MKHPDPTVRLLQILPTHARGGNEGYALTIAREARVRGWDVGASFPEVPGTRALAAEYEELGVRVRALDLTFPDGVNWNSRRLVLAHLWRATRMIRRTRPHLVHVAIPWPEFGFSTLLACGLLRVPTVAAFQLVVPREPFTGRTGRALAWAKARGQTWVAVSRHSRDLVARIAGIDPGEIELVYNGSSLPPDVPDAATARTGVRRELGLPPGALILFSTGRLHPQKGYDLLPPVLPHVFREFGEAHFVLAGDGPDRNTLTEAFRARGLEGRVHLLGHRADVPRLLRAADLFVFPTRYEGHPFALVEAMAAGVPVVTSLASGIGELVVDRESGVVCRTDDVCDLLESIKWALRRPTEMAAFARRARTVAAEFSTERMLTETFGLFERILAPGSSS
jgi:glycosyltransferase involved in cell wall biosynthesis